MTNASEVHSTWTAGKSVPTASFQKESLPRSHGFAEGHKLESVDPENQNLICVVSVRKIQGSRLLLHFDGYGQEHDFWQNAASQNIFPAGWCKKYGQTLTPPKGYNSGNFCWQNYLELTHSTAAPPSLFLKQVPLNSIPKWSIGMKLEAEDKYDRSIIAVATVANIIGLSGWSRKLYRVLVHFDGWPHDYDYWTSPNGPYVHPVGWCKANHRQLLPPKDFGSARFSWRSYLRLTRSQPVPESSFNLCKSMQESKLEVGMQLEAVDMRNPALIRLAKVQEVDERQVRLHYDGWPQTFDSWVDDTDPRLYPMGYCDKTGHDLMYPFTPEEIEKLKMTTASDYPVAMASDCPVAMAGACPVPGCLGHGHVMGAKYTNHQRQEDCPYSLDNFDAESKIPYRLQKEQTESEKEKKRRRKSKSKKLY